MGGISRTKDSPDSRVNQRLTFVVSGLTPKLGLETVTLNLIEMLAGEYDIHVASIGGVESDTLVYEKTIVLGPPVKGHRRIASIPRLFKYSRRSDLGIVVVAGVWASIPWLLVAGKRRASTIVWEHSLLREKYATSKPLKLLHLMSRWLYPKAAFVVGVSDPVTTDILSYKNIQNAATIPNHVETPSQVDLAQLLRMRDPDPFKIVCVGSLTAIKSQRLAIEALSHLDESFTLTIIGSGVKQEMLEVLATELGVSHRVEFTGFLEASLVRERIANAAVMLHCSVAETFGLVYVEAANLGIPVLSVETRVSRWLIPDLVPGLICERDPKAIAAGIIEVLNLTYDQEDFLRTASLREQAFGLEAVLEAWLSVLAVVRPSDTPHPIGPLGTRR